MFCSLKDHQQNLITHLCIQKQCNQSNRWLCKLCQQLQIHKQDNTAACQIIDVKEIENDFKNHIFRKYFESRQQRENNQADYRDLLEARQLLDQIIDTYDKQIKLQESLAQAIIQFKQDIQQISNHQFNLLLNIENNKINKEAILNQKLIIMNKLQLSDSKISNYQTCFERQNCYTQIAQISPNESQISYAQYFTFTHYRYLLIENFITNKCLNKKIFKNDFDHILYSNDSQFLFIVDNLGFLRCYQTRNKFKQLFNTNINKNDEYQDKDYEMLVKNSKQIIINAGSGILVFEMTKRTVFQIQVNDYCPILDYDHRKQQLIASSNQGHFLFMNELGQLISQINIDKQIVKIKKIRNDDNILVQNKEHTKLYLYFIDYEDQKMIVLQKYKNVENYFQFQSLCDDEKILLIIDRKRIIIFNKQLQIIQQLFIKGSSYYSQVQSLKYILVANYCNLSILKKIQI